eukprot:c40072_g1_i1 orf=47-352(-)
MFYHSKHSILLPPLKASHFISTSGGLSPHTDKVLATYIMPSCYCFLSRLLHLLTLFVFPCFYLSPLGEEGMESLMRPFQRFLSLCLFPFSFLVKPSSLPSS